VFTARYGLDTYNRDWSQSWKVYLSFMHFQPYNKIKLWGLFEAPAVLPPETQPPDQTSRVKGPDQTLLTEQNICPRQPVERYPVVSSLYWLHCTMTINQTVRLSINDLKQPHSLIQNIVLLFNASITFTFFINSQVSITYLLPYSPHTAQSFLRS
jgi:hypothetical protein